MLNLRSLITLRADAALHLSRTVDITEFAVLTEH